MRLEPATGEAGESVPRVRGLVLPALLASLLASGRWQHPGDDVLRRGLRAERRIFASGATGLLS